MKQHITNMVIALAFLLGGGTILMPAVASAATFKDSACEGVNTLNGTSSTTCDANAGTKINGLFSSIIQVLSIIVGFVAVIMIIVGGMKFITAGGDSGAIASARTTIVYALIGLIIVALAQILVHYVIRNAT